MPADQPLVSFQSVLLPVPLMMLLALVIIGILAALGYGVWYLIKTVV